MKLNKEQIAFAVVLLLVGYLTWDALSETEVKRRKSRRGGGAVPEYETATMPHALLAGDEGGWDEAGRNVYRAPSEHSPLPPLNLPAPPRAALPVAPPQTVPGLGPYGRVAKVAAIEAETGVELPPREARIEEEEADEDEEVEDETFEITAGDEVGRDRGVADELAQQMDMIRARIQEEAAKRGVTLDESQIQDALNQARGQLRGRLPSNAQQDEDEKETAAERRRRERREKKIASLRDRLAKKAAEELQEQREEVDKEAKVEEVRRSLDRINWKSGEIWYGKVQNDAERKPGSKSFDRYEIKLAIDSLRADTTLSAAERDQKLADREMEVEFRRWRVGKSKLDNKQKHSAANIASIDFADSVVNEFQLRRRQVAADDLNAHRDLARRLVSAGEYRLAKEHVLGLVEAGHQDRELYVLLADSARRDFDYEVEMRALDEGLDKFADHPALVASLGDMYSRLGLAALASDTLMDAVSKAPSSARAHARFGRHILESGTVVRGKVERALESLDRAAAGRSDNPAERAEILVARGQALLEAGRVNDAARAFNDVVSDDPSNLDAKLGQAAVAHLRGDHARAKEIYEEILEESPEVGPAYHGLGLAAIELGEWGVARDALYDAMSADPFVTAKARCALGYLYERIGNPEEAQVHYSAAYEADPKDPEVIFWNGRGSMLLRDHEQAHDMLLEALAGMPDQLDVLSALSETSYMLGRYADALRYVEKALEQSPDAVSLLVRKAQSLSQIRQFTKAKETLDLAKKKQATDEVELSLAHYYYEQDNHIEALKRFRTVERSLERSDESPTAVYTRRFAEEIEDNLSKQVWSDHFNRVSTGQDLLRGWKSHAPGSNVSIGLAQNRVSFSGKQRRSETPSCIFQQRRGKEFVSFEAGFYVPRRSEVTCGVALFTFRKNTGDQNPYNDVFSGGIAYEGLMIAKTPEGRVAWRTVSRYEMGRWQVVPEATWPDNNGDELEVARLGIEVSNPKKGTFKLSYDGTTIAEEVEARGLMRSNKEIQLWAFTQAEIDKRVDVKVDDVRIVTRKAIR